TADLSTRTSGVERVQHAVGIESLAEQVAIQPVELTIVRDRVTTPQPFPQRKIEERFVIDAVEHLVNGALRGVFRDAGAFDLHPDAQLSTPLARGCSSRNRLGDARIVDRAFLPQGGDRRVYRVGLVALAREPLPHLQFGKLAS